MSQTPFSSGGRSGAVQPFSRITAPVKSQCRVSYDTGSQSPVFAACFHSPLSVPLQPLETLLCRAVVVRSTARPPPYPALPRCIPSSSGLHPFWAHTTAPPCPSVGSWIAHLPCEATLPAFAGAVPPSGAAVPPPAVGRSLSSTPQGPTPLSSCAASRVQASPGTNSPGRNV